MTNLRLILISSSGNNIMSVTSDSVMRAIGQEIIIIIILSESLLGEFSGEGRMIVILRYVFYVKLFSVVHN